MGWTSGFEVGYGEIAGAKIPNCADMRPYCNFATFGRDAVTLNEQFAEDYRYPIQYKREMTDFVPYCYFPLYLNNQQSGWFGFDIKTSTNNRGEWQLSSRFKILNMSHVTQYDYQFADIGGFNEAYRTGMFFTFGHFIYDNNKHVWAFGLWEQRNTPLAGVTFVGFSDAWSSLATYGYPKVKEKTSSPEFGPASVPDGGYNPDSTHGTFDFHSDEIPIDPLPDVGVTSAGFINVYKIEENELVSLGEKLFPHFLPAEILADPSQLSVQEVLVMFLKMGYGTMISPIGTAIELNDNLGVIDILMNGKLIDYVLDCHVIPTSLSGSTISPLRIGYRTFNDFQLAKATTDYVNVDCGDLSIDECFGNFLDYTCKVQIYLPFVGFVDIANEYWNNATLNVTYQFNIIDGSFQCKLLVKSRQDEKMELHNSVIGQYGGVCCVHFPITGLQYSNVISGLVNGSLGVVSHAGMGDMSGVGTNLAHMAMLRPDAPMSNGYNASSSFLSQRTPYLVVKRPAPQFSENYQNEMGLPLNVYYPLNSIHGFTTIDNPVLSIKCSDEEYNEIVTLLRNGVIF